jgi:hypothetical protein
MFSPLARNAWASAFFISPRRRKRPFASVTHHSGQGDLRPRGPLATDIKRKANAPLECTQRIRLPPGA